MKDKSTKDIPEEQIRAKAYEIWKERKGKESNPEGDWHAAMKALEEKKFWSFFTDSNSRDFALEVVKTVISALGLVATVFAGVGLLLTFWNAQEDRRLTQERLVTERFSQAIELLGKEKDTTVRIGGIYALEQIADDYQRDYYWTIIEVLTSYVREHSPLSEQLSVNKTVDIDVQVALTVIGRLGNNHPQIHLEELEKGKSIDLNNTNLTGANLTGSYLTGANLIGANLTRANLTRAILTKAKLKRTELYKANLTEAELKRTELYRANLTEATLSKTKLEKVILQEAILKKANLINAVLRGADLTDADFREAIFSATDLKDADIFCANLSLPRNLTPRQVKLAKNYDKAIYDDWFREQLGLPSVSQSNFCNNN